MKAKKLIGILMLIILVIGIIGTFTYLSILLVGLAATLIVSITTLFLAAFIITAIYLICD